MPAKNERWRERRAGGLVDRPTRDLPTSRDGLATAAGGGGRRVVGDPTRLPEPAVCQGRIHSIPPFVHPMEECGGTAQKAESCSS